MLDEKLLRAQYKFLGHCGLGWTEFRVLKLGAGNSDVIQKAWAHTEDEYVACARNLFLLYGTKEHIFVSLNPRSNPGVPSAVGNISHCNVLMIDIDPIRPKGIGSSEEQHAQALALGNRISMDIPNSILVDSGSGAHVYLPITPIKVIDAKNLTRSCKEWSDEIIKKYSEAGLRIDSVFDLPRVSRLWGSFNHKSSRHVKPISRIEVNAFPRTDLPLDQTERQIHKELSISNDIESRFRQLIRNNPQLKSIMEGHDEFVPEPKTRSEADYAFIAILTKAQMSIEDIKNLARRNPLGRKSDLHDKDIDRIVDKVSKQETTSVSLLHSNKIYLQSLVNRKMGIPTGLKELDAKLAGLQPGKLYVIGARTNEGKTSFACCIAYQVIRQNIPVLFFPTELGYEPLFDKIVAQATGDPDVRTGVNLRKFQTADFTPEDTALINEKVRTLSTCPFIVHEDFALTLETLCRVSKQVCPGLIVIDYIQAMKYNKDDSMPQQIGENMRGISELSRELNVPIILTSQFNRGAIGNEVSLGQFKGSGAIEEMADVAMAISTLTRIEYPRSINMHILKSRYSEIGIVPMSFYSSIGKFVEGHK